MYKPNKNKEKCTPFPCLNSNLYNMPLIWFLLFQIGSHKHFDVNLITGWKKIIHIRINCRIRPLTSWQAYLYPYRNVMCPLLHASHTSIGFHGHGHAYALNAICRLNEYPISNLLKFWSRTHAKWNWNQL